MLHQFYFTHCTPETSIFGEGDYGIRAASLPAREIPSRLFQTIASLAPYYLPRDMSESACQYIMAGTAPIRLARIRMEDGRIAVVHSVYRATDTLGRTGSFFSHLLIPPQGQSSLSTADVLHLWGAEGRWGETNAFVWQDRQGSDSAHEGQLLPIWQDGPARPGALVNALALQRFLLGDENYVPPDRVCLETTPARLRGSEHYVRRREILEFVLMSHLIGERLYLVAEPGLAALLVFALTQLLPPSLTEDLTFSTFEACHQGYWKCKANIVNTFWDPRSGKELDRPSTASRVVALNTFTADRFEPLAAPETTRDYARYVLDILEAGKLDTLQEFWLVCEQVVGMTNLDCRRLLDTWRRAQQIAAVDKIPLGPEELHHSLEHPRWRSVLLKHAGGRRQAVETVFSAGVAPVWWPSGPDDEQHLGDFRLWLDDFRKVAVHRIAQGLVQQDDTRSGQLQERLERLLSPLVDASFPLVRAFQEIVERLESLFPERELAWRLTWNTRQWVLRHLCSPQSIEGGFAGHREKWLRPANMEELARLCDERIPDEWKIQAIKIWLETDATADTQVSEVLIHRHSMAVALPGFWGNAPAKGLSLRSAVDRLFHSAPSNHARAVFFLALLSALNWPRSVDRSQVCQPLLSELIGASGGDPVPWHLFFDDRGDLLRRVATILQTLSAAATADFWAACCTWLDGSCLFAGEAKHKVLMSLIAAESAGSIPWRTELGPCRERLRHWHQLVTRLSRVPSPNDLEWLRFRVSLRSTRLTGFESRILGALLQTITSKGIAAGHAAEIAECATALAPHQGDPVALAKILLTASQAIEPAARAKLQEQLVHLVCEQNPTAYNRIIDSLRRELSPDALAHLEASRDTLGRDLVANLLRKEAKRTRTINTLVLLMATVTAFLLGMVAGAYFFRSSGAASREAEPPLQVEQQKVRPPLSSKEKQPQQQPAPAPSIQPAAKPADSKSEEGIEQQKERPRAPPTENQSPQQAAPSTSIQKTPEPADAKPERSSDLE